MRTTNTTAFLSIVLAALLLGLAGCQQTAADAEGNVDADAAALRAAPTQWDALFNAGDAAALALLYSENAVSMPPGAATVRGREAIRSEFEGLFAANAATHETMLDEVQVADGWAIERARYSMTLRPRDGAAVVTETGRHVMCRERVNGQWLIAWELWNVDPPSGGA